MRLGGIVSTALTLAFSSQLSAATYQINITADGFASSFSINTDNISCYVDSPTTTGCSAPDSVSINSGATINQLTFDNQAYDVNSQYVIWQSNDGAYQTLGERSESTGLLVSDDQGAYNDGNVSGAFDVMTLVYRDPTDYFGNSLLSGVNQIRINFAFGSHCNIWAAASGSCSFPTSDTSGPFNSSDAVVAIDSLWANDLINAYDAQNGLNISETTPFSPDSMFTYSLGVTVVMDDFSSYELTNVSASMTEVSAVPVPAAVWLFGSGLLGLMGVLRRRKVA